MNATAFKNRMTNRVKKRYGENLTVTRPGNVGQSDSTFSYYFIPVPLTTEQADTFGLEGAMNIAQSNAHNFITSADNDVREGDYITYNGETWEVISTLSNRLAGVSIDLNCLVNRVSKA